MRKGFPGLLVDFRDSLLEPRNLRKQFAGVPGHGAVGLAGQLAKRVIEERFGNPPDAEKPSGPPSPVQVDELPRHTEGVGEREHLLPGLGIRDEHHLDVPIRANRLQERQDLRNLPLRDLGPRREPMHDQYRARLTNEVSTAPVLPLQAQESARVKVGQAVVVVQMGGGGKAEEHGIAGQDDEKRQHRTKQKPPHRGCLHWPSVPAHTPRRTRQ